MPPKPTAPLSLCLLKWSEIGNIAELRSVNLKDEFPPPPPPTVQETDQQSIANLRQLAVALLMYVQDHNEKFPTMTDAAELKTVLLPYLGGNDKLFYYPGTAQAYSPNPTLSNRKQAEIINPTQTVVIFEAQPSAGGTRGVAFADGHAKRVPEADWPRVQAEGNIGDNIPASGNVTATPPKDSLRQIALAVLMCTHDNANRFPPLRDADARVTLLKQYLRDDALLKAIAAGGSVTFNTRLSGRALSSVAERAGTVLLYETAAAADGTRGVAYADGHTARVAAKEWEQLQKQLESPEVKKN
jgi:prepilin-type processing-associated H-X9-DG protein